MAHSAKLYSFILGTFALLLTGSPVRGESVVAQTTVSPSVIMEGQSAEYTVSFRNTTSIPNLMTPRVGGLDFSDNMSTSTYQQIINGRSMFEVRASWSFRPTRTGSFTIPGRTVELRGEEVDIPPVTFEVVEMDRETRSRAHLIVEMDDGPFHVGQAIPARIGLYVRTDLRLGNASFPERSGDAFVNSEFDRNPERVRTRINGIQYEGIVWAIVLTPIKTGDAELRFAQDIALETSVSDNRFPSLFNMRSTRTENMTLLSEPLKTEILPLPEDGQPESFSDAIGKLEFSANLSSRNLMVGEPLTLTLTLEGQGNFERISPPEFPESENWRVYPPKIKFEPSDRTGFTGRKSFEYILIPQSEEITTIPELSYSVFNPDSGQYVTTVLEAETVAVKPSDKPITQTPLVDFRSAEDPEQARIPESLLPIRPEPGYLRPVGAEGWRNPVFWYSNGGFALAMLLLAGWQLNRKRFREDKRLAQRHLGNRKIRKALQEARQAADSGDASRFFPAARYAIQERVSHLSSTPVRARTLVSSDCLSLLHAVQAPEPVIDQCARLLDAADTHQFAGISPGKDELSTKFEELNGLIVELNRLQT